MSRKKGLLTVKSANNLKQNIVDVWSEVLQIKVPRNYFWQFSTKDGINIYLPTSETVAHGGTGAETLDLNADAPIVDSAGLTDDLTAKALDPAGDEVTIDSIDYANNQVVVDHDTAEDVTVHYLAKGGSVRINVYRPSAGINTFSLFDNSISTLHLMEQDNTDSLLRLDNPFPVPEKHLIKIEVNAPYQIDWETNIAHVSIPYRQDTMRKLSPEHRARIRQMFVAK